MLESLRIFALLLVIPLTYSCQTSAVAQDYTPKKETAYAQATKTKHTKHIRKKQRKICDRLRKIRERLEKRKKRKNGRIGGK